MNTLYTAEGTASDKETLWMRYAPLVRSEALRLQARLPASVELDDLIQAGVIGLLSAFDHFNPQAGASFSTYATQRIRWAMLDELRALDWVPRSIRRHARDISKVIQLLEQRTGAPPSDQEVADELSIPLNNYHQMLADTNFSQLFSLDELQDLLGDKIEVKLPSAPELCPLEQLLKSSLRQQLMDEIAQLPEREQLALNLYYQQELNLKEIGAIMEIGESRVSQIHSQAIKRLRGRIKRN